MKKTLISMTIATLLAASSCTFAEGFPTAPGAPAKTAQPSPEMAHTDSAQPTNATQPQLPVSQTASPQTQQTAAPFNATVATSVNGVQNLPPLTPPTSDQLSTDAQPPSAAFSQAAGMVTSLSPDDVRHLRSLLDQMQRAKSYNPVRAIPKISSLTVNMSSGSSMPILRTMSGQLSTIVFEDETGAPWPIAAPPKASSKLFEAEWLGKDAPSVTVWSLTAYGEGNLVVWLKGLTNPVIVQLTSGEPNSKATTRVVDSRLNLRIPQRGPLAKPSLVVSTGKIGLYDDTLQQFLDGVAPKEAKLLTLKSAPNETSVWRLGDSLFVRTPLDTQTIYSKTLASSDGMHVYQMEVTPYVTLSDDGKSVTVQVGI